MAERVAVVLRRGGERRHQTLSWRVGADYRITVDGPGRGREATGPDLFAALAGLRRQLEAEGWRIAVQGARLDTYPSGMARDMGGGRRVYVLHMGRAAASGDLVDTLDPVDDASPLATVDEQERRFQTWLAS
ncbi:MAG: hypothetical protein ACRD0P_21540 [Stackebrandtia sp.]